MKCEDLLRTLNDYVDGEIDPGVCDDFAEHLQGCNPCQIVVDTIRKTVSLYKNEQVYEVPLEFRTRMHDALRDRWQETHCGA
ncbi:MAG: hypothetical protein COZ06_32185 [Armatimonadetes bacterium CG_4_10_14_3_um_filter_66_18]|nr:zf-HC2 domain-containing protein [Armatimonadota bacterium]NCQ26854.1 zf-HC2 domain-containing protein [Armatimonadota bacterium]PIU91598.1 MAG: hypothetical protein COS65_21600 [Armatimonadetes bacterium CG06_land_8_20_14_3_00_66_21]PIY37775.1 MAG: hypothetical protein COZ06_32185 [Armatimonadetes bacterium CG_4_10_14_3_um_filter_66_18]